MNIRVENLVFSYDDFRLEIGSLVFAEARVTSIVGPNGAGKSTFLKCAASVLAAPRRSLFVDGKDLTALHGRERAKLVGYVPQEPSFTFNYTVLDFVLTGRAAFIAAFSSPAGHDVRLAEDALQYVGLSGRGRRPFLELSSGERRLVLIARALAQGPEVLLLDEPTSFLDPRHEVEIMTLCRRLAEDKKKTVVVTLHNLEMAVRYSDAMVFMKGGKVVAAGAPGDILSESLLRDVYDLDMRIVECAGQKFFVK
jgi:iron complex transport system ATP-binding protein